MTFDETMMLAGDSDAHAAAPERERITVGKAAWAANKLRAVREKSATMLREIQDAIDEHQRDIEQLEEFIVVEGKRLREDEWFFANMLEGYYHQQNEGSSKKKPVHLPGGHTLTYSRGGLDYTVDKTVVLNALLDVPESARPMGCVDYTEPVTPTAKLNWNSVKSQASVLGDGSAIVLVAVRDADGHFVNPHTGELLNWGVRGTVDGRGDAYDEVFDNGTQQIVHPLLCFDPEQQHIVMALPGVVAHEKPREFVVKLAENAPQEGGGDVQTDDMQ